MSLVHYFGTKDARQCIKKGREFLHAPFYSKVCKPYGVGIAAWLWFDFALSFPFASTAVVT